VWGVPGWAEEGDVREWEGAGCGTGQRGGREESVEGRKTAACSFTIEAA
jgi:hypothetical protein